MAEYTVFIIRQRENEEEEADIVERGEPRGQLSYAEIKPAAKQVFSNQDLMRYYSIMLIGAKSRSTA